LVGSIEKQQGRLTAFRGKFEHNSAFLVVEAKLETRLARDVLNELGFKFEQHQFVPASL
jgi:hypothetical protein